MNIPIYKLKKVIVQDSLGIIKIKDMKEELKLFLRSLIMINREFYVYQILNKLGTQVT